MNHIYLKKIGEDNFLEAFHLQLGFEQERFVSNPIRSLAQAYVYYNQCIPFGIYVDAAMVGYMMVIYDFDLEEYNIWHMMIDAKFQNRGYGKKALERCLEFIKTKPYGPSNRVVLTCNTDNKIGMQLYESFGFKPTGNEDEDEIELGLTIQ